MVRCLAGSSSSANQIRRSPPTKPAAPLPYEILIHKLMASRSTESCDSASGASTASRRPVSILLEQVAHFTDNRNETTAAAKSLGGYTMAVSFWMANPPDLSFFSVHCSKPPDSHPKTPDFKVLPHVVGAQGPFVLLRARLFGCWKDEYFMTSCTGLATARRHRSNG